MATQRPLQITVGPGAAELLQREGWRGRDVSLLLGASGGPKWLILGHLDRVLAGEFLFEDREVALEAVGSSVGSWRHACMAQDDPAAAYDRFEDIYVNQTYSEKPDAAEISEASIGMLNHILGEVGTSAIIDHDLLHTHIVTARGRGLAGSSGGVALVAGMAGGALGNAASRRLLAGSFQRVIFNSRNAPALPYDDFGTTYVPMTPESVFPALHASGSIPFVLTGERDIDNAPPGHYWDGGIIDYHFDLADFAPRVTQSEGLLFYPHFRNDITPGWFDKFLPWRRRAPRGVDHLVMISPSKAFIESLPHGKIPDRSDFTRMTTEDRLSYWRECIARSKELAEDFRERVGSSNPLEGVSILGESR